MQSPSFIVEIDFQDPVSCGGNLLCNASGDAVSLVQTQVLIVQLAVPYLILSDEGQVFSLGMDT